MVTMMTKEEYKRKYGVAPVRPIGLDSELQPAPRSMTRAEYDAEFGVKPQEGFYSKAISATKSAFNTINKFNPLYQIPKMAIEGGLKFGEGVGKMILPKTQADIVSGATSAAAGATQGLLAVPFGTFEAVTNLPGVKQVKNFLWGTEPDQISLPNLIGDKISDIKPLQDLVTKYENVPEIAGDLITTILGIAGAKGLKEPQLKADIQAEFQAAYNKAQKGIVGQPATETTPATGLVGYLGERQARRVQRENQFNTEVTQQIADDLVNVKNGVARKSLTPQQQTRDMESATRLAETDALSGMVNSKGSIDPLLINDAIARYRYLREGDIDRSLVKNRLIEETKATNGATATNLGELTAALVQAADRFTGSFRDRLDGAIESEIRGLSKRADESGRIKLEDVHQAKIDNALAASKDYGKLSSDAIEWRKAKARVYKEIIERNSKVSVEVGGKTYRIKDINAELGKTEQDIAFIRSLGGRPVEGGRLGKHFASISGNLIGYAAGSMFGLIVGAIGSAVGGELARGMKSEQFKRTFGEQRNLPVDKNAILQEANKPQTTDILRIPDKAIKAAATIKKTTEIIKVEAQIKRNVEAQKKAIKKGDFTLVATLKEIYKNLVQHLKDLIKKIKETPNKQGGFISIGSKSTPTLSAPEAVAKGMSKEEFVKAQGKQSYRSAHQLDLTDSISADKIDIPKLKEAIRTRNGYLNKYNQADLKKLEKLQNNPDADITIYRASPKNELNDGDWITTDKIYANDIKRQNGGKVYSYTVKVKDLSFPKDVETLPSLSMASTFNYAPKKSQLTDIWKKAQSSKREGSTKNIYNPNKIATKTAISDNPTTLGQKIKQDGIQKPTIQLKRDVTVTTLSGEKAVIDAGEVLKAYESGGKALLKDGREYIVSKSQYENIKNNSLKSEAKEFAPELKGTEETIKGGDIKETPRMKAKRIIDESGYGLEEGMPGTEGYITKNGEPFEGDFSELPTNIQKAFNTYSKNAETVRDIKPLPTKYSSYQLPDGKNYKEILIKAPSNELKSNKPLDNFIDEMKAKYSDENMLKVWKKMTLEERKMHSELGKPSRIALNSNFKSSHFPDEPNAGGWLRLNQRDYKKPNDTTFLEETQDILSEAHTPEAIAKAKAFIDEKFGGRNNFNVTRIKRALQEAVKDDADYFSWINGEQTSARYSLATKLDNVKWKTTGDAKEFSADKIVELKLPTGSVEKVWLKKDGTIIKGPKSDWAGQKLDQAIGKGLADKIMEKETGTLSGEGLKFGGEWADTLYNKQVGNIVKDLTGAKIEVLDMGLPIDNKIKFWKAVDKDGYTFGQPLKANEFKIGKAVSSGNEPYIIIDILGDGKFKAVPKRVYEAKLGPHTNEFISEVARQEHIRSRSETFDISTKKTTQQGIRLTEDVKRIIRGEAPKLK